MAESILGKLLLLIKQLKEVANPSQEKKRLLLRLEQLRYVGGSAGCDQDKLREELQNVLAEHRCYLTDMPSETLKLVDSMLEPGLVSRFVPRLTLTPPGSKQRDGG